ncbi:hypothetical protein E4T44_12849 [Aureobasidium sp. EXF-8845]|nr:hypothetical protein E4T44_12849 [Aureobasidium sp. EXF-8845]KAI4802581.1 hypothetical protein E4T45_11166 [Aureobasidium sp. EXF-8846]
MPKRHAASGDASPSPQGIINVAIPRQSHPPTRLKLKVRPREPISEPQEPPTRPKRKISRPARYLDNECEPLTKKRRTTTASTMSLQTPTSPALASESPLGNSSDPVMLTSSKSGNRTDHVDSNEVQHAGYSADFLIDFIDDTPRSSLSALDSVIGSQNDFKSDALPEADGLVYHTFTELTNESPTYPTKDMQSPILDGPEVCVEKLQSACHALSGLNMSPVPPQRQISLPMSWSNDELELVSISDQKVTAHDGCDDTHNSVDALLAAATGFDQVEGSQATNLDEPYAGQPDDDIHLLISKAIEILRHHIANIRGFAMTGRQKQSRKDEWNTDAEQLVLSTLEPLLYSSATNIGCMISSERSNLLWQLYSQLTHFVTAPHVALSRTLGLLQQTTNGSNTQHHAMARSKKRSLPSQKRGAVEVPAPHKFLSRQKIPS